MRREGLLRLFLLWFRVKASCKWCRESMCFCTSTSWQRANFPVSHELSPGHLDSFLRAQTWNSLVFTKSMYHKHVDSGSRTVFELFAISSFLCLCPMPYQYLLKQFFMLHLQSWSLPLLNLPKKSSCRREKKKTMEG